MKGPIGVIGRILAYGAAGSAVSLVPVFLMPFLTSRLGSEGYGLAMIFLAWSTILLPIMGLGTPNALGVRAYQKTTEEFSVYFWSVIAFMVFSSAILLAMVLLVSQLMPLKFEIGLLWVVCMLLVSFFWSISQAVSVFIIAIGEATTYLLINSAIAAVSIVTTVTIVASGLWGWQGFSLALLIAHALGAFLSLRAASKRCSIRVCNTNDIKDSLRFGAPVMIHSIAIGLITYVDRAIISHYLDNSDVGVYSAAFTVAAIPMFIGSATNKAVVPWYYSLLRNLDNKKKQQLINGTLSGFLVITVLVAGYAVLVEYLSSNFFMDDFRSVEAIAPILCIGAGFNVGYLLVVNVLFFASQTKLLAAVSATSAIVFCCASVAVTPRFGLQGAAYCFTAANALLFFLTAAAAMYVYEVKIVAKARAQQ